MHVKLKACSALQAQLVVWHSYSHLLIERLMQMVNAEGCGGRMSACSSMGTLEHSLHCLSMLVPVQDVSHPMVVVDCSSASGVEAASQLLLGGLDGLPAVADYSRSGVDVAHDALLLSALTDGTLVLNNIHKVC